jgi:hypothetical protein
VPRNWIEREKIRAAWSYPQDGADKVARLKAIGINTIIMNKDNPELDLWEMECAKHGLHLFVQVNFSFDARKAVMQRVVFDNGFQGPVPCPADEEFWEKVLTAEVVQLAKEGLRAGRDLSGITGDFELYLNNPLGGQNYYTDACFCDRCFAAFAKHKGLEVTPDTVPFDERLGWLKGRGVFADYHPFLQGKVRARAAKLRETVHAVNPGFVLGFYPTPFDWMLQGVAQGFSTPEKPMIVWGTDAYEQGGAGLIPDRWK